MTGKLAVVFGGSGFIGRNVVRELAKRGWRVRVAVRRPHLAQFLRPMGAVGQVQLIQANIRHRQSVAAALKGADAVINLVGILSQSGPQRFETVQSGGAATVSELAAEAGITEFVQMSAIGADDGSLSEYARTKGEAEASVRKNIPDAVILRPSIVFGQEDEFFNRFAELATISPVLPSFGGGKTKFQPVYVDDVACAVCEALSNPSHRGRIFELGGPVIYSYNDLMELMFAETGRKRFLAPIPFAVAPLLGWVGEIAGLLPFVTAPITRDQITLLKEDNVVTVSGESDMGTIEDFGVSPSTVEAILPSYMVRFRKYGQFAETPA